MSGDRVWTVVRWLYGLFFLVMGLFILVSIIAGIAGPPPQPTPRAQAFTDALSATGFIDPLLGLVFTAGGAALLLRRTTPLGLVVLASPVAVILFFHLLLSGQVIVGSLVALVWTLLAWRERSRFEALWSADTRPTSR